jgi:flagellin-like hook-associated protein FlgL
MTSDVVLSAALRSNLLSLQNTQRSIDATQLRLATGLKVNSALDNPQNFFAAQALGNRANDLQRLLDGIGQNIQVIKAADNGVTALTSLVEQAESVAQSAQDALAQGSSEARETGDKDLSTVSDLTQLAGINDGDTLTIRVNNPDNKTQFIDFDETTSATQDDLVITINAGDSINELITEINDNNNIQSPVIEASLTSDGQLEIKTLNGGDFQIDFISNAPIGADTDATNLALASALGFGEIARVVGDETINANSNNVQFSSLASRTIKSFEFFDAGGSGRDRAERSDLISTLEDVNGTALFGSLGILENFTLSINGGASISDLPIGGLTIQGFIDTINSDASVNQLIRAGFDDATSQITITAIDESVTDITIGAYNTSVLDDMNFGFGLNNFTDLQGNFSGSQYQENIRFGKGGGRLAELELEYNSIKNQIDQLVSNGDTGYRGTNLIY